jgi:hypothetical protein
VDSRFRGNDGYGQAYLHDECVSVLADLVGNGNLLCVFGVAFVVLTALAVHATRGFQDVLGVEAAECSGLEDLVYRMLGDHHPLRRVRHR